MGSKYTTTSFKSALHNINPNIKVIGEYVKSSIPIKCECEVCKTIWYPTPNKLIQKRGCPKCANKKRGPKKDQEKFEDDLLHSNPTVKLVGEYINGHTKASFQCLTCGNVWEAAPYSILARHGCPKCHHTNTSFAEQFIYEALSQLLPGVNIISRDRSAIGKELDIYIPDFSIAIEYNGWFWHKNKIKSDVEKSMLCKNNNITYIGIYDSCPFETLSVNFKYYTFSNDLGIEKDCHSLKSVIIDIIKSTILISFVSDINNLDWESVIVNAHFNSRSKTTDQFKDELQSISNNIIVLGQYTKSSAPIKCKCSICGFIWNPTPNSLLSGNGCPSCSHKINYGFKEISSEIINKNLHFKNKECSIVGDKIVDARIEVKCNNCGKIWYARYSDLLRGHGCGCNSNGHNKLFKGINDLNTLYPQLEKEWNYTKNNYQTPSDFSAHSSKKVWWTCSVCQYEWQASISSRAQGSGCPLCYKEGRHISKRKIPEVSFLSSHPELVIEWDEQNSLKPNEVSPFSSKKVWWKCKNNHKWLASVCSRSQGSKCPYCTRKKVLSGYNDLKTTNPDLACEWDYSKNNGLTPDQILSGSHKKIWWTCKTCGFSWQATANDRSNKHGCPKCAGKVKDK